MNKRRRLQVFRDKIFNRATYKFNNPSNCLVAQMVKSVKKLRSGEVPWASANIRLAANFYGIPYDDLREIESDCSTWENYGAETGTTSYTEAVNVINYFLRA